MTYSRSSIVGGWISTRDAEHAFGERHAAGSRAAYAGTVFVPGGREVEVVVGDDPAALPEGARMFVYPGHHLLVGALAAGDLVARSGIDQVRGLGGVDPVVDDLVDTQAFVRPLVERGRLVLLVRPAAGGMLVPFEQPHPTPCCADHV
ncbi:hypothetical protein BH10ACT10_BH10ACT10_00170 [soil metagenome]